MKLPSKTKCYQLICDMEMMEHIVFHSLQVCQVALLLVSHLNAIGKGLNRELVQASALLHDITKTRSFKTMENHAHTGGQFLIAQGYPEVGHIVRQHVVLDEYLTSKEPTEAEIVNYADKRVLHDQVVPLEVRKNYILEKYGKNPEHCRKINRLWEKTKGLENRLFRCLPIASGDIHLLIDLNDSLEDFTAFRKTVEHQKKININ